MHKVAVPISLRTLTNENINDYIKLVKDSKIERVFIGIYGSVFGSDFPAFDLNELGNFVSEFKKNNIEVGIWVEALGHGVVLTHERMVRAKESFTLIEGADGGKIEGSYCPMDPDFREAFKRGMMKLAKCHPDILMIDDDFRLNARSAYYMGCFCKLHLNEFYKKIGEVVPRSELEKLIFTGGKNKYRDAYMEVSAQSLLDFAKYIRSGIDEIDPSIRLGACTFFENWDYCGTDAIELAKAFAGNTKPFLRTTGAPYSVINKVHEVIEDTRLQAKWCNENGVEVFGEGDVYPRPRYNVPAKKLEIFDIGLLADGRLDGNLKYMIDYNQKIDYELGYIERHNNNEGLRNEIKAIFKDKTETGVRSINIMHKIKNWELPDKCVPDIANTLTLAFKNTSRKLLAGNSIPSTLSENEYPVLLIGENARYINESDLKNGAILDAVAAKILTEKGYDVGLKSITDIDGVKGEYFPEFNDEMAVSNCLFKNVECKEGAEVLSTFTPNNAVASYRYENGQGQRFFVLALDMYLSQPTVNYCNNYYRQEQLVNAIEWAGNKKLPVKILKNPDLYIQAAKNENSMSVLLINNFADEIIKPEIQLDRCYNKIKFVNCDGELVGDKVVFKDIQPYAIIAFEVKD